MSSPRKTPPKKRRAKAAKSSVLEESVETKNPRGQKRRKADQTSDPKYQETEITSKTSSTSKSLQSDQQSNIPQPLLIQRSRSKKRQVLPLSVEKTSQNRTKRITSPPATDRSGRSRSKSPKGKGVSLSSSKAGTSSASKRDSIQTDKPIYDIHRISSDDVDTETAIKSPDNITYIDLDNMETRSRSKTRETPQGDTPSRSTPRSRRTAARTRPVIKQEPQDDFITNSGVKTTTPPTEAMAEFSDTPKHLYGLDKTMGMSSGEEDVLIDSDSSSHSPQKKIKEFFLRRTNKRCSCWCVSVTVAVMFIVIAVISALLKPSPHIDAPTVQVNDGQDKGQDNVSWNSKSLRELQEKLDQLSAQVSAKLKVIKEDTRIPYNESIHSKKHLGSYIEGLVKAKMEAALDVYSADKLGIPDYALESAGGQIHGRHHSPTYNTGASRKLFGFSLWYDGVPPRVVLQPDNTPGRCWAFEGQEGYIVIRLSLAIVPDMFTLEHIPSSLSTEEDGKISNAPKDFSVWGWMDSEGHDKRCIGKYTYDNQSKSLQTFKAKEHSDQHIRYIELQVSSNHGHATHTCIYRFRVHGKLPGSTPTPPTSCSDAY